MFQRHKHDRDEVYFCIKALENCAVHPKYLDAGTIAAASMDPQYLHFADQLHTFVSDIDEFYAARGSLDAEVVEKKWKELLAPTTWKMAPYDIAGVYLDRLIKELKSRTN